MAEYTLKINVDPSELRSQLQAQLGKIKMGGMFGGGGGAGGMGGAFKGTPGQQQHMNVQMLKLMQLQIKKAEGMQRIQQKGWAGKFGPTAMKLAGIAMGLAALRQVGKALIDSSPLLQAIAKIGQTAFTLFLRPLGDFIGFILRPFMILMLKYGIQFYKKFGGAQAMKDANQFLTNIGLGPDLEGVTDEEQWASIWATWDKNVIEFGKLGAGIADWLTKWPTPQLLGYKRKSQADIDADRIEDAQEEARDDANTGLIHPWEDFFEKMGDVGGVEDNMKSKEQLTKEFNEQNEPGALEHFAALFKKDKEEKAQADALEQSTYNMIDMSAKFGEIKDLAEESISRGADPAKNANIELARRYIAARNAGITASDAIINIADIFKQAEENIVSRLKALAASKKASGDKSSSAKLAEQILAAGECLLTPEGGFQSGILVDTKDRGANIDKYQSTINAILQYNSAFGEGAYQKLYPDTDLSVFSDSILKQLQGLNDADLAGYLTSFGGFSLAKGGVINEPVIGRGLRSGRAYAFGEQGAETVTPGIGGDAGGVGGNITANFYITGVNPDQFETMVKPMVFRWFNELKSNRGIT